MGTPTTPTAFGYPVDLGGRWEDRTVYTFELSAEAAGAGDAAHAPAPSPLLRAGSAPPRADQSLAPNLLLRREPLAGRELGAVLAELRRALAERLPAARTVREGVTRLGSHDARDLELSLSGQHPAPTLAQWHALLARDGFAYHACLTTTRERLPADLERARELLASWA